MNFSQNYFLNALNGCVHRGAGVNHALLRTTPTKEFGRQKRKADARVEPESTRMVKSAVLITRWKESVLY